MVHHHIILKGNLGIFCSFPHACCARECVRNLNQTRAGLHTGEEHGTEGQEEGRGKGPAEQQKTCIELSFSKGLCFMEKILQYSFSVNTVSSPKA